MMARQTASERADLQGAAGVAAAEAEAEGVTTEQDLDNDGDVDDDDAQIEAAFGADDEGQGDEDDDLPALERATRPRRGPGHDEVTAGWGDFDVPSTVGNYLKPDEHRVIPMRRHLACLAWPAVAFFGGLILSITLNAWAYSSGHAKPVLVHALWWSWIIGDLWAIYKWLEWRGTWFVVTGFRVMYIETTHLLGRRVRMVPIDKLRDVEYSQTPFGRIQGYASFAFASIGTGGADNALTSVDYLPNPEWLYQRLSELTMPTPTGRVVRRR